MKKLLCKIASRIIKKYGIIEIDNGTKFILNNNLFEVKSYTLTMSSMEHKYLSIDCCDVSYRLHTGEIDN